MLVMPTSRLDELARHADGKRNVHIHVGRTICMIILGVEAEAITSIG